LQASPAAPQAVSTFGASTASVLLDVVVRDKKGNLVRDLEAADFDVSEDSARQTVDSFRVVSKGEVASPGVVPPASSDAEAMPAAAPVPSVIAFVFDRVSAGARDMARKAALAYTSNGHVEGDVAGIFVVGVPEPTQPFTTDLTLIRLGIDRALGQVRAPSGASPPPDVAGATPTTAGGVLPLGREVRARGALAQATFERVQVQMARALESLEQDAQGYSTTNTLLAVVSGLRDIPGRKTLIFFSQGLIIPSTVQAQFRSVIASANRANVSVYAVDAGGLPVESQTAEARREIVQAAGRGLMDMSGTIVDASNGGMMRELERNESLLSLNPESGLKELAEETGGFLIRGTNDASGAFRRLEEDMRFHYLLWYTPTNETYDGSFRSIAIKLRRPGLVVQARKGYFAVRPSDSALLLAYQAPALAQLDRLPKPDSFPLGLQALSFPEAKRPGLAPVVVEIPGDAIAYTPNKGKDGAQVYDADLSIVVRIRNEAQQEVDRLSHHYLFRASAANLKGAKRGSVIFYREAILPPGRYTFEAAGYDAVSRKASVREEVLEVPAVAENRLRLSSIVLVKRADKLGATEKRDVNPLYFGDTILYPNTGEPFGKASAPAVEFYFVCYGAGDPGRRASLEVRNQDRTVGATTLDLVAPDESGRIQQAGALPLQSLRPGSYSLRVTVSDSRGSDSRTVPFTVAE
jgi:VWFA-related protein